MNFQPPPTWALPVIVDERTGKSQFNPIWLNWFVALGGALSAAGITGQAAPSTRSSIEHNALTNIQGGGPGEYYHLTQAQLAGLNSDFPVPNTVTVNQLVYSPSSGLLGGLTTANNSLLRTDGSGVPSWGTTLPAVTLGGNIAGAGFAINNAPIGTTTAAEGRFTLLYSSDASFLLRKTAALPNGAAAALGTLANAPSAGNPTKWIPVDDNGTTRYIPTWL